MWVIFVEGIIRGGRREGRREGRRGLGGFWEMGRVLF